MNEAKRNTPDVDGWMSEEGYPTKGHTNAVMLSIAFETHCP
jgi:hypothetical protein